MNNNIKQLRDLTIENIDKMDYNNLISLTKETNRIPGGYKTIASIINNIFQNQDSRFLEIGTSTGSTAIEISKILNCKIDAVDINQRSINEAKKRAEAEGVIDNISFKVDDAQNLSFEDDTFDCVICGNVTSLIPNKEKAREEYTRVLKENGFLVAVPMYYIKKPSKKLLNDVSDAIQADVQIYDKDYWINFYNKSNLILKYVENYEFEYIEDSVIENFVDYIMNQEFLKELKTEVYNFLYEKYRKYIYLFRDNLSHMGYSILLYKNDVNNPEPELFRGRLISER